MPRQKATSRSSGGDKRNERIEKYEDSHLPGNAAAMREALKNLTRFAESDIMQLETLAQRAIDNDIYGGGILQAIIEAIRDGKEALSKPPRNCDTLETYNDFVDAWNNHVRSRTSADEPIPGVPEFLAWLSSTKPKGSAK